MSSAYNFSPNTAVTRTKMKRSQFSVLVVDDQPAARYAVARAIREAGYNTAETEGGIKALELAQFTSAVVLDVHLPDMDGIEVCRELRLHRKTRDLPVILMSAVRLSDHDRHAGEVAGAMTYLLAPVDPELLVSTLDRLLGVSVE